MSGTNGSRKRPYEKKEVAKWMSDLRDGTPKSFSTFKYLKVVPSLLKEEFPAHSRSVDHCDDLPETTGYVVCSKCRSLFVASGGHLQRHVDDCYNNTTAPSVVTQLDSNVKRNNTLDGHISRKYTPRQLEDISNVIAVYGMKAAASFNQLGDTPFHELLAKIVNISAPGFAVDTVMNQLPSRQSVRRRIEEVASDEISTLHQDLRDLLKLNQGFCGLVTDHGKVIDDHLSMNIVLIDDRQGKWELKCFPIAFRKAKGKSTCEVRKDFEQIFFERSINVNLDKTLLVVML